MRRALLSWCLLLAGIVCIAQSEHVSAFWQSRDSNYNNACAITGTCTGGGGSTTTFDPSNLGPFIVLSNGNLTATAITSDNYGIARSVASHSTGKYYAELTMNSGSGGDLNPGAVNNAAGLALFIGDTADKNSVGGFGDSGVIYYNGGSIGTAAAWTAGNVVSIAVDFGGSLIWYRTDAGNWNNSGAANPATGAGGFSFSGINAGPYYLAIALGVATNQATANFGGTSYAQSVPAGFGNW